MIKAVGLFSGGLDSLLAIKLVQAQNIDVTAVPFKSPFFINKEKEKRLKQVAKEQNFKIKFIELKSDYLKIIRKPKYGHGKNLNPCIDCHAFMLKKAKQYAKKIKAKFIFTGEVLDERPMSQNMASLNIVEKESGLKGKLLRPLSAKLLPETEAEIKEYIDRNKLLDIRGRTRKPQFELARKFNIKEYETPAGGCLLTNIELSKKLKDLFKHKKTITVQDCELLKLGRHFRYKNSKIIVGRNEKENKLISKFKGIKLEPVDVPGPTTLLQGKDIKVAAQLTARYSDSKRKTKIKYKSKIITVEPIKEKELEKLRI